jgi:hypothetical protein
MWFIKLKPKYGYKLTDYNIGRIFNRGLDNYLKLANICNECTFYTASEYSNAAERRREASKKFKQHLIDTWDNISDTIKEECKCDYTICSIRYKKDKRLLC